jgi:hypothetical protein
MSDERELERAEQPCEPPRVEQVLTREELAREIHYAGVGGGSGASEG